MRKIKLILGTSNSVPYGLNQNILEAYYDRAYKPFMQELYKHPKIAGTVYVSGILYEWFEDKHPEFLMMLNDMVKGRQLEILSGAYYDPILPLISSTDRMGQIEMLTTFIRKRFSKRPRGGWIPESVWEPSLAFNLKNSGLEYVFLEDNQFLSAGVNEKDLFRPIITEDQGKSLLIFPVSTRIMDLCFTESPGEVIQEILDINNGAQEKVVSLMFDGQSMGAHGTTFDRFYRKKWLSEFFDLLEQNSKKIEFVHPGRYIRSRDSFKRGYLGCMVTDRLAGWMMSLDNQIQLEKVKNAHQHWFNRGYFRQFLDKYEESAQIYGKMMFVNHAVRQIRGDKSRKKSALNELWKAQNSAVYWHGPGAGLLNSSLRKSFHKAIMDAEKLTRERGIFKTSLIPADIDLDGQNEVLYQGQILEAAIHPKGAHLFELFYLPKSWNYLDAVRRYKEIYHDDDFIPDAYPRRAFIDHIFDKHTSLKDFTDNTVQELGDFVMKSYKVVELDRDKKEVTFSASGKAKIKGKHAPLEITKKFSFKKNIVQVDYKIHNLSDRLLNFIYGVEQNWSFPDNDPSVLTMDTGKGSEKFTIPLGEAFAAETALDEIHAVDLQNELQVNLTSDQDFSCWTFPVEAIDPFFDGGTRHLYQASCFLLRFALSIPAGKVWENSFTLKIEKQS